MASADFVEGSTEDNILLDEDDDVDDRSHKKLLNAVSSLYRKQRISAPKRNEPSLQISEFNLAKSERKKKLVPTELLKGLGSKAVHQQIHNKIKEVKKKLKPLPKPLEKFEAEKIVRETGYENVKEEVSKWNATVQKNRAADRLIFPLRSSDSISMEPERDILATFSKPTELELKMAEVLNKSSTLKELKEEAEAEKLTLAQLIQRRNMIAKMRHRESYRIAKAVRQNKIKSKKYHRMLKRDRIRNELKEFELLQKTDPEAALAKLEKVERARAEERISLRHRNTGKWAKGLAIRAKYDAEARSQLADNLRKSRELTEKLKSSMVSDSEEEGEDDDMGMDDTQNSAGNPWVDPGNEVASFVEGYRKFWEEQNNKSRGVIGIKRKDVSRTAAADEASENENSGVGIERETKELKRSGYKDAEEEILENGLEGESSDAARNRPEVSAGSEVKVLKAALSAKKRSRIERQAAKRLKSVSHSCDVGANPNSTETDTKTVKEAAEVRNTSDTAHSEANPTKQPGKKFRKPGNKKAAIGSLSRVKKSLNMKKMGIKSNKLIKSRTSGSKSKKNILSFQVIEGKN